MTIAIKEMFEQLAENFTGEGREKAYKSLLALTEKGDGDYTWLHLLENTFKEESKVELVKPAKKPMYQLTANAALFKEYYALCDEHPDFKKAAHSLLAMTITSTLLDRLTLIKDLVEEFKHGRNKTTENIG